MPVFVYRAVNAQGTETSGSVEAPNQGALAVKLKSQGLTPLAITEGKKKVTAASLLDRIQKPVKTDELIIFTRQMISMLKAGVPVLKVLDTLTEQSINERFKSRLQEISRDVEAGTELSEAFRRHPRIFTPLYISTVKAGEAGGSLPDVLTRLVTFMEFESEITRNLKSALRYPMIVVIAISGGSIILLKFVIPKFAAIFGKAELPLPTQILMNTSAFVESYWYIVIGGIIGLAFLFRKITNTPKGRFLWDGIKLKIPIFGPLILKVALSRFTKMLGTLYECGVPIIGALNIVADTVGNDVIAKEIIGVRRNVEMGKGIASYLKTSPLFPPMVVNMIDIGEKSGALTSMLEEVSKHYDMETTYTIENLTTMIEPILTLFLGAILLVFALAIFLPMWNMINLTKK